MTNDDLFDFSELVRQLRNNRHPNGLKAQAANVITALMESIDDGDIAMAQKLSALRIKLETEKEYVAFYQRIIDKHLDIEKMLQDKLQQAKLEHDALIADLNYLASDPNIPVQKLCKKWTDHGCCCYNEKYELIGECPGFEWRGL